MGAGQLGQWTTRTMRKKGVSENSWKIKGEMKRRSEKKALKLEFDCKLKIVWIAEIFLFLY